MTRKEKDLKKAKKLIADLRAEFWENVLVGGTGKGFNQSLEKAGRVADFLQFGELMVMDALERKESCGCHFNEDFQTDEHEALRDDENFCHVSAWEYRGEGSKPKFHKEPLEFENVELTQRSYK
jgi:succinate dehydrogenase / fumarate reductase flavoprotein subunit